MPFVRKCGEGLLESKINFCRHHFSFLWHSLSMASFSKNSSPFLNSPGLIDRQVWALNIYIFVHILSSLFAVFGNINIVIEMFPNPNYVWICLRCLVMSPVYSLIILKAYSEDIFWNPQVMYRKKINLLKIIFHTNLCI